MTTSGTTTFGLVTNEIVTEAFDLCGVGSEGEAISADQYERARRSLNLLVKAMPGDHLWLRTEASVALVASQADYALTTLLSKKPRRVLSVRRKVTSGAVETPLLEWSREAYFDQPNKTVDAVPTAFYYDPQRTTGTLYLWPRPSTATAAAMTLNITYLRPIEDFTGSANDPDLPQEWTMALAYMLAEQLALKYGVSPRIMGEIKQQAAIHRALIEAHDTEPASLYMSPE